MNEHDRLKNQFDEIENREKKSELNAVLSPIIQAWEKAARHYEIEAKKQPNLYMQGVREGAYYKLESCAETLRQLIKENG